MSHPIPPLQHLVCWVHVQRKFTEGKFKNAVNHGRCKGYASFVQAIHDSRTPAMAKAMAERVMSWMADDQEFAVKEWFEKEYLSPRCVPELQVSGNRLSAVWPSSGRRLVTVWSIWPSSGLSGPSGRRLPCLATR